MGRLHLYPVTARRPLDHAGVVHFLLDAEMAAVLDGIVAIRREENLPEASRAGVVRGLLRAALGYPLTEDQAAE